MCEDIMETGKDQDILKDTGPTREDIDIIKEVQELNSMARKSKYPTYSKSTYWNQQNLGTSGNNQEALLKEIKEILLRIDAKLAEIVVMLNSKA